MTMKYLFATKELARLAQDPRYLGKWSGNIISMYRLRLTQIKAANSRHDLYELRSLRLKKLKGSRSSDHSIRLNNQYRMIIRFTSDQKIEVVNILAIEDYH